MAVKDLELWRRWRDSRETHLRDRLVEQYLWLVRYVAGRLMVGMPPQIDQADVEAHGCFGLLEAVDRFDPERGVRFETYAIPWIRGACIEGLRAMQWAPAMRRRVRQLLKLQEELAVSLGRDPEQAELAAALKITVEQLEQRIAEVGQLAVLSLDEPFFNDEGDQSLLGDRLVDEAAPDPMAMTERSERRDVLVRAVESLPEKERLVISLLYVDGLMAREASEVLGLSQARISQLHSKAILRLRGKLARLKAQLVS